MLGVAGVTFCSCRSLRTSNVTGTWKGILQHSERPGRQWNALAELTLLQQDDVITGTLVFNHPDGGTVQIPISSGVLSGNDLQLTGHAAILLGSVELTFHGKISGPSLTGNAALTSRAVLGSHVDQFALRLDKQ